MRFPGRLWIPRLWFIQLLGRGCWSRHTRGCLAFELNSRGIACRQQVKLPVNYRGHRIQVGYRIDLFVADLIIVEVKSVEKLVPIHDAQLLTYLKLADKRLGLLLNFNVLKLKDGIKRLVNNLQEFNRGEG